ncbi:LOW QUALITY PROTEIN: XK-related protein 8 [Falco rusticolus]|uniref:LOW QUALITY PROTEIN: XK-related protein 8 n=1 Tax=Falco rusticolus TaxID=120794 RepID=UPI0018865129|nr:LOW QUALITY PROTEIN: XK-related protein 8 [Falco rusticolus]XP_055559435.1 LOW QUALITY PROTEIN: XK-related protein 8 [Falco cherrug]XP_055654200.1 LOW QUALITY PROTEIN: XK-related protein 8 [Falco peregrinus]
MAARAAPPRFGPLQLALAAAGTVAAALDVCADGWVAAGYARGGQPGWAALALALLAAASVATQACSWLWLRSDPPALRPDVPPGLLAALHVLQLGILFRCLHALKVGWKVCWEKAEEEEEQSRMAFLSHDISMLRLFETFLENTPQLILLLYVILRTNKAEPSQGLGICTALLCVTWSLLDYHQSLRSFLRDKYELSLGSSVVYFLWNFFLICPRILVVTLFALLLPYGVAVHFSLVWLVMFIWVSLQGTDFMESPGPEKLYRAMVAVILYFSWFNVAQGRTLYRSIIYHGFILVDSTLLALSWLWCRSPSDEHSFLIPVVSAALPCYLLGLALRVTYYRWLHPNRQAWQEGGCDEVDAHGRGDGPEFRSLSVPGLVNRRMWWLAQTQLPLSRGAGQRLLNGAAATESAV